MRLWMVCFFSFFVHGACADVPKVTSLNKAESAFNVTDANKQFDHINLQLSVQDLNLVNLNAAVKLLTKLVAKADDCASIDEKRVSSLNDQIQETKPTLGDSKIASDANKSEADLVYLQNERKKWASEQAQCRLFSIRAKEAIDAYETAIAKLKQEEALTRGLAIWSIIGQIITDPAEKLTLSSPELSLPAQLYSPVTWGTLLVSSLFFAGLILLKSYKSKRVRHYLRFKSWHVSHLILLTLCLTLGALAIYLQFLPSQQPDDNNLLIHLTTTMLLYTLGLVVIIFLFKVKKIRALFCWYSLDSYFFQSLMIFLLSFYALSISARMLAQSVTLKNDILWQLGDSLFLLAVLATAIYFIYYFCNAHRHIIFIKQHHSFIRRVCVLLFIACGVINFLGYHTLSMHLTFAGISTFAIIFATILIEQAISKIYNICTHAGAVNTKIVKFFGYKPQQTLTELFILKVTVQVIIFALALYLISQSWGYATYYIESAYTQFLYGIHFATFTFYPTRIIAGIIVFCMLYLLFRSISTALSRHEQFEDEEETQVAIASILTYIGFAFAIISALLVAGFDFTGLAIVAGALSVGIGLGLQSIVNNFVSGIILLIEKPIKPGDRIQVDGVEGIVKKIRVRSTQITTSAREDIIIPNSDLITHRVTNYMYSDKYLSIHCEVGVSYGSDTKLVRDLLLSVTNNHDDIIKTQRNKPTVLFRAFGDNALIFHLWFLIKDGNKKSEIKSELHFEIERLFREHNISFALPQRDIHIKLSDIEPWIPTK
ncbi:MAG: mechanosensitive ion channel [Legionellaceae bacterium]|nr:mechanosensitive ion channel [Legionellaceae bacterium]